MNLPSDQQRDEKDFVDKKKDSKGLYFRNIYQGTTSDSFLKMWFKHKAAKWFPIRFRMGLFAPFMIIYLAAKAILSHICGLLGRS